MTDTDTTVTRDVQGATIAISAINQLAPMLDGVLSEFEQHRAEWRDGFSVWMGWCPLTLRAAGGGFVVQTPDFTKNARSDRTDDASLAIWAIVRLTSVAGAAGVEPVGVDFDDDVICVKGWESSPMIALSRTATTSAHDSGWFVEPFPRQERPEPWRPDELVRLPAWRILQLREAAAHAMALPVGVSAIIQGDALRAVIRESDREVLFSSQTS